MRINDNLRRYFDAAVCVRGAAYFSSEIVVIEDGGEDFVEATARGASSFRVTIAREGARLEVSCTCREFDYGDPCRHIWAAVLAAEREGFLGSCAYPGAITEVVGVDDDGTPLKRNAAGTRASANAAVRVRQEPRSRGSASSRPIALWEDDLRVIAESIERERTRRRMALESLPDEIMYVINVRDTIKSGDVHIEVFQRVRNRDGAPGAPREIEVPTSMLGQLPDAADRTILLALRGGSADVYYDGPWSTGPRSFQLLPSHRELLLPAILATGRVYLRTDKEISEAPLALDGGPPWEFFVEVVRDGEEYVVRGILERGEEHAELAGAVVCLAGDYVVWPGTIARLAAAASSSAWLRHARGWNGRRVAACDVERFLGALLSGPVPPLRLPAEFAYSERCCAPIPMLCVERAKIYASREALRGDVRFRYGEKTVRAESAAAGVFDAGTRTYTRRDLAAEEAAQRRLRELGLKPAMYTHDPEFALEVPVRAFAQLVRQLVGEGWRVEADGKAHRKPGKFALWVTTGIDWFELHGNLDFEGATCSLPALLAALKQGEGMVLLDDGSMGLLPEEWLAKCGLLARLGETKKDHVRFTRSQAGILDALLAEQPEVDCDERFERARAALRSFESIGPADPGPEFHGELRPYQRVGLGWLRFVERFGFGGCLADDMGLGKTVQVLALLATRRGAKGAGGSARATASAPCPGPSLVVAPRSVIFNWRQEAARFAPGLRVLDNTGLGRVKRAADLAGYDLVLTTYATLRRDAVHLKDVPFDYLILDEAQAIKNMDAATTKAARLLRGEHRLALSGTPVENHLGELWSIFEFLNPGMLGAAAVFKRAPREGRDIDPESLEALRRALRPFILRRTKEQVMKDLPAKLEETLWCELDDAQRELYDELRDHYRGVLTKQVRALGIGKAKMQILTALLRLRQAACHPGLLDPARAEESSAKLDALLPQLQEIVEEGHKALIFSQFTSLLAIVRRRLDDEALRYEYLDGATQDREACVARFQNDPELRLFLISLRAGGLGLNLTAADYVFLLDPWWNPAVEAQAIDRTHRIGQTRPVFAYRVIARDTVEEKILALQQSKRDLADAIITADDGALASLTAEDLEMLLG